MLVYQRVTCFNLPKYPGKSQNLKKTCVSSVDSLFRNDVEALILHFKMYWFPNVFSSANPTLKAMSSRQHRFTHPGVFKCAGGALATPQKMVADMFILGCCSGAIR